MKPPYVIKQILQIMNIDNGFSEYDKLPSSDNEIEC